MSVARTAWAPHSPRHPRLSASRRIPASSWLIIFLTFALPAASQDGTKDLGEASLEELGNIQVYSVSKHMQSTSDAPSSVTVITADEIQKCGYSTLAAILESVRVHKLTLSAGLRYDHYSDFGGTTNPRLGLIYHLAQPTTLKLLYGTAFRAPEPFELAPDYGAFFDNNPNLKPETIGSLEGIVEQQFGPNFTLSGSVFRNRINDLITIGTNPSDNQDEYFNSEKAVATGVEVELDARLTGDLQGRASYSYVNATQPVTQQTLANSPQQLGKLDLSIPVVKRRLFANLDAQYTSSAQTLAGNTLGGFSVLNFTSLGHTLGKPLDLSGSVYNVFNKKYFDPGRPEDPEDSIQQDGRNFRIKLTGRF
jgi:outer membrane receptor for ferrienterochelin and colicins